jgi:hypothetical protein
LIEELGFMLPDDVHHFAIPRTDDHAGLFDSGPVWIPKKIEDEQVDDSKEKS